MVPSGDAGLDAQEDEPGVVHRGVRHHPLDVGLHGGEQGADDEADHGQGVDDRLPVHRPLREGGDEDPQEGGEGGDLDRRGHEAHRRRRRSLVDVGAPRVERRRRHLEAEADQQQHQPQQEDTLLEEGVVGQEAGDGGQVGRAGGAVDEGDAVEEEGRGERPQHEVLEARLLGLGAVALHGGQDVGGDGEDLEAEEDHDEVAGDGHHHAAGRRQQQEHVVLRAVELLAAEVVVRHQGGQHHGHADDRGDEGGEAVHGHRPGQGGGGALVLDALPQVDGAPQGGQRRDDREGGLEAREPPPLEQGRHQDQGHGADGEAQQRQQGRPGDVGRLDRVDGVELGQEGDHPWASLSLSLSLSWAGASTGPLVATAGWR